MILGISPTYFWLSLLVICLVAEAFSVQLVSLWFALGSLGALIAVVLGVSMLGQWALFIALSLLLMVLLRPLVRHVLRPKADRTNADRIVGQAAVVIEAIDNQAETGQIRLMSQTWTARTVVNGIYIPEGSTVYVDGIAGVKAMVVQTQEELGGCRV